MFWNLLNIFFGYLFADFLVGIYHWVKDSYFSPHTPIIGKTFIWNSRLHHVKPRYVVQFPDWNLFKDSAKWTLIWMAPWFIFGGFTLFNLSLFLTISMNDIVHKYAHTLDNERPKWVWFLQTMRVFQTHDEHHSHHIEPHEVNYCPISSLVNPILEKINFWKRLENIVEKIFKVKPRARQDLFVEDASYPGGIKFVQEL